jgi:hypothetical protein
MLVQHFHSISEIDAEFITGLSDLLADHMLSIEQVHANEKCYPDHYTFLYTLYFMQGRNSPVGISRAILQKNSNVKNKWLGPFKTVEHSLFIKWSFPSLSSEAMVCNPIYKQAIWIKLLDKHAELKKREGYQATQIIAAKNDHQYLNEYQESKALYCVPQKIKKTAASFEDFLTAQNIQVVEYFEKLESIVEEHGITISGHKDFVSVFFDSKYNSLEIENLKNKLNQSYKLQDWININAKFMALWQEGELIALAPFSLAEHNFYFSLMPVKEQFPQQLIGVLLSTLLERFFHTTAANSFIPLVRSSKQLNPEIFRGLGFECTQICEYELKSNP